MTRLVDYAGLFPPASLDMMSAVRRYRQYLTGEDRWSLGRFVVPAARLLEFSAAFNEVCCGEHERVWTLSVLASGDRASDEAAMDGLTRGAVAIDSVEMKAASAEKEHETARAADPVAQPSPMITNSAVPATPPAEKVESVPVMITPHL